MEISESEKAYDAMEIANSMIEALDEKNVPHDIAYSALGCAFSQVHFALGKTVKDWKEISLEMAEIFSQKGNI